MAKKKKEGWPGGTASKSGSKSRKTNTVSKSLRKGEAKTIKILMGSGHGGKSTGKKRGY